MRTAIPVRRDKRSGKWYFRTLVRLPDGRRERLFGVPAQIGLPNNERLLDTSFFDTAVARVIPEEGNSGDDVRVVIHLKEPAPYHATQHGSEMTLEFARK